jgi:SulP family sulfate permease
LYWYAGGEVTSRVVDGKTLYSMASAAIIGNIPSGLPQFTLPVFHSELLADMVKSALILAALGSIDSLLTSLVADNQTRSYHRSNRELIGQGIGNMASGIFGGLPGAGATMRTVVNIRAGGRTPISGALHALLLLGMVLGLGSLAEFIPLAVLAGILIKVGTDIIDWKYLKQLRRAPKAGILLMVTVFSLTVFVDLISAVAIGMIMAAFIFMKRMTDVQIESMHIITGAENDPHLTPLEQELMQQAQGKILVYKLSGPRSFTSARDMVYKLAEYSDFEVVVFDLSEITMIDFTSCQAIADIVEGLQIDQHHAYFAGGPASVLHTLEKLDGFKRVTEQHIFDDRYQAIHAASELVEVRD